MRREQIVVDGTATTKAGRSPRTARALRAVDDSREALFDRHGQAAYGMALVMLASPDAARRAVVELFVSLGSGESVARRSGEAGLGGLAAELYGRCVAVRADPVSSNGRDTSGPTETDGSDAALWASLPLKTRDSLALAMFGVCGSGEIAELVNVDRADVHRRLSHGLKHLALMRAAMTNDIRREPRGARISIGSSMGGGDRGGSAPTAGSRERTVVVDCEGELDAMVVEALADALAVAVELEPRGVVVDMQGVALFDASAIGAFVEARRAAGACGSTFELTGVSRFGRRVLDAVGLGGMAVEAEGGPVGHRGGESEGNSGAVVRGDSSTDGAGPVESVRLAADLGDAARERFVVEQARGVLAHRMGTSIDGASKLLDDYALRNHESVVDVATWVMARSLDVGALARPLTHDVVEVEQRDLDPSAGHPHGS